MKKIIKVIKKIIFGFLILYGFNFILSSLNIFVPINVYTLGTVSTLGFPGLFSLVIIYFITR